MQYFEEAKPCVAVFIFRDYKYFIHDWSVNDKYLHLYQFKSFVFQNWPLGHKINDSKRQSLNNNLSSVLFEQSMFTIHSYLFKRR